MGCRFRRQYGIGRYIVDFYSPEARLAIEIDGESHYVEGAQQKDQERQAFIESQDIEVLAFYQCRCYGES
jgi:very-short-patch-repair endonuclease